MIAESSLALPGFVYTSVSDRHFFYAKFFLRFLSWHFFWGGISALDFFYLSALLECCLSVLAESRGRRIILLLFVSHSISKNPKTFAYHHTLHFALCIVLALDFLLGLHIGKFAFII